MDWLHAFGLAVIQGLTEFLPISSSAHLVLVPSLLGWPDQGLSFDIAVHVGTLLAVCAYFRGTLWTLLTDWTASLRQGRAVGESALAWYVIIATIPVVVGGVLLNDLAEKTLRAPLVIATTTLVFGVLLWAADRFAGGLRLESQLRLRDALIIGASQVVAIVPGTSRSGITMTAGLFLGMTPTASARFSFLLSVPTIALAGIWKGLQLISDWQHADWGAIVLGIGVSAVAAYACIAAFLALLDRTGMTPFVIYRLLLGVLILMVFL